MFWDCFVQLDGARMVGMESSPIQPGQVLDWCRVHGLTCPHLVEELWKVTHLVDRHRINQMREAQQEKPKNANARRRD